MGHLRLASGAGAISSSAEARAIAYLATEVPAWRQAHPCYSCHNNGDAARALVAALGRTPASGRLSTTH